MLRIAWRIAVAALLLLAAASKVKSPIDIIQVLIWDGLSGTSVVVAVWLIVLFELLLGTMLILSDDRRLIAFTLVVFLGYTVQLAALYQSPTAPGCGCLKFSASDDVSTRAEILGGIFRNMVVILAGAWLLCGRMIGDRLSTRIAQHA